MATTADGTQQVAVLGEVVGEQKITNQKPEG